MEITVYKSEREIIPTQLAVIVDGKHVAYDKIPGEFAYRFHVFQPESEEEAMRIVDEVVRVMCHQSYDHGAEWRVTDKKVIPQDERYATGVIIRVGFRIKDSY